MFDPKGHRIPLDDFQNFESPFSWFDAVSAQLQSYPRQERMIYFLKALDEDHQDLLKEEGISWKDDFEDRYADIRL